MNIKELYIFRPGYIHPVNMRRKKTFLEKVTEIFYPLMKTFAPNIITTSEILAKVMIDVGVNGHTKDLLNNIEINSLHLKKTEYKSRNIPTISIIFAI